MSITQLSSQYHSQNWETSINTQSTMIVKKKEENMKYTDKLIGQLHFSSTIDELSWLIAVNDRYVWIQLCEDQ